MIQGDSEQISEEIKNDINARLNRAVEFGLLSKNGSTYTSKINFNKHVPQHIRAMLLSPNHTEPDPDYIS